MGELEADDQILRIAEALFVRGQEGVAEFGQIALVSTIDNELIRICPPIGPHCHGFAAVNQLRPAFPEPMPAAEDVVGYAAGGSAIPAFHRLDSVAIADLLTVDGN